MMFGLFKKKRRFKDTWILVKLSEYGELLNVDHKKIVIMYGDTPIKELPYCDERLEQLKEKYPVVISLESGFERPPYNILIMNRFEFSRLGFGD